MVRAASWARRPVVLAALAELVSLHATCPPRLSDAVRSIPLDQLLAGESGNDLEGREIYEDVTELRAGSWGIDD
jgi:hypothetical protein